MTKEFFRNMWQTILAGSVWQGTLTNKRKDGVLYQEEMTITPVRSKRGEITHFVAVKQDITERLRAEQRLRETEQFFRSVLELAPDGLMVADEKGVIRLANAQCEKLFGYTRDELIGQPVEMLVPAEFARGIPPCARRFTARRTPASWASGRELRGQRKDGSLFPVEIGLSPLPAREGEGAQVAVSIRDITERKHAEAELKKRSDELQQHQFPGGQRAGSDQGRLLARAAGRLRLVQLLRTGGAHFRRPARTRPSLHAGALDGTRPAGRRGGGQDHGGELRGRRGGKDSRL